jgi:hypothetical protein
VILACKGTRLSGKIPFIFSAGFREYLLAGMGTVSGLVNLPNHWFSK